MEGLRPGIMVNNLGQTTFFNIASGLSAPRIGIIPLLCDLCVLEYVFPTFSTSYIPVVVCGKSSNSNRRGDARMRLVVL